jgi:hypothetical protein
MVKCGGAISSLHHNNTVPSSSWALCLECTTYLHTWFVHLIHSLSFTFYRHSQSIDKLPTLPPSFNHKGGGEWTTMTPTKEERKSIMKRKRKKASRKRKKIMRKGISLL